MVLEEAKLWVEASRMAMIPARMRRVDGPWEKLLEAGRLLSLDDESFERLASAVKYGRKDDYEGIAERLEINEMSEDEVADVLTVREDYQK